MWTKVIKLNTYRITNRNTEKTWEGKARSVWEACKKARSRAEDCRIEIKVEGKRGSLAKRHTWREIKLPPAYFDRR